MVIQNHRSLNPFTRHNLLPTLTSTGLSVLHIINFGQDQDMLTAIGFGTMELPWIYLSIQTFTWHLRDNPEVHRQIGLISLLLLILYYTSYDSEAGISGSFFTLLTYSIGFVPPVIWTYFDKSSAGVTPELTTPLQRYGIFSQGSNDVVLAPQEPTYSRQKAVPSWDQ